MFADGVASLLSKVSLLLRADLLFLPADLLLTARGTVSLPPEGRQVYRPRDGRFTARGAVSDESAGKSDGDKGKRDEVKGKRDEAKGKNVDVH